MVSETFVLIFERCGVVCDTDDANFYRLVGVFETSVGVWGTCDGIFGR